MSGRTRRLRGRCGLVPASASASPTFLRLKRYWYREPEGPGKTAYAGNPLASVGEQEGGSVLFSALYWKSARLARGIIPGLPSRGGKSSKSGRTGRARSPAPLVAGSTDEHFAAPSLDKLRGFAVIG